MFCTHFAFNYCKTTLYFTEISLHLYQCIFYICIDKGDSLLALIKVFVFTTTKIKRGIQLGHVQ